MAAYNKTIGRFQLDGIAPAPRGVPQIEVTFDIDSNGIMHVTAQDRGTGKEQKIRIEAGSGLSEAEIEKMVQDAKDHADEDRKRREEVDVRNKAEALVYQTEKNLSDIGDKVSGDVKARVEAAALRTRQALEGSNSGEIRNATDDLERVWQEASAEMYRQAQAAPQETGNGSSHSTSPGDESEQGPVEADYEVVDEK
jgi:molecular chaperone DnaK